MGPPSYSKGKFMSQQDDVIKSASQLAQFASELTDYEVGQVAQIVGKLQRKFASRPNTPKVLDELRDEALTKLAEIGILATVDPTPCFHNEPPIIEIIGKVPGHEIHSEGFDHERKRWEVQKANALGEAYRGQKEKHKG
jgi:hypothetical protein